MINSYDIYLLVGLVLLAVTNTTKGLVVGGIIILCAIYGGYRETFK